MCFVRFCFEKKKSDKYLSETNRIPIRIVMRDVRYFELENKQTSQI